MPPSPCGVRTKETNAMERASRIGDFVMSLRGAYAWVAALLFLVAAPRAPPVLGQSTTLARLIGTVTDPSGASVPGAQVTAHNKGTNVPASGITDERGNYLIDKLPPGLYDVSVEVAGFKKQVATDVRLAVEQRARVDFALTPGVAAETVTVTGQTPVIDTASAELGAVVDEKSILELPLSGRELNQ